ncbi:MAG: hypothetical protein ACP5NX_00750 [Candidatus Bilamarchaeaceae archaeon]
MFGTATAKKPKPAHTPRGREFTDIALVEPPAGARRTVQTARMAAYKTGREAETERPKVVSTEDNEKRSIFTATASGCAFITAMKISGAAAWLISVVPKEGTTGLMLLGAMISATAGYAVSRTAGLKKD